jgi:uncharacterized membrane protein
MEKEVKSDMTTDIKESENLMGAASYLLFFITGILFLLIEKQSRFVRFHAMQSTIFFGAVTIVIKALGFFPYISWILGSIIAFGSFILWIVLMWKAFQGEYYKLPYIGDIAEKQLIKMT